MTKELNQEALLSQAMDLIIESGADLKRRIFNQIETFKQALKYKG